MVPKTERRHRLNPLEIDPVKDGCYYRLIHLLEERNPEDLLEASLLFRVWFRIDTHCTNKPKYPDHDIWEALASNIMKFGTVKEAGE